MVDQEILLIELGTPLKLFHFYLRDREQFVQINVVKLTKNYVYSGVPWGSVLGPLLFSLNVLRFRCCGLLVRYHMFADDIVLVYSNILETIVNNDLATYKCWLLKIILKISVTNTVSILFKQKKMPYVDIDIKMGNMSLITVDQAKYLCRTIVNRST